VAWALAGVVGCCVVFAGVGVAWALAGVAGRFVGGRGGEGVGGRGGAWALAGAVLVCVAWALQVLRLRWRA
jgi:hypothetical protein